MIFQLQTLKNRRGGRYTVHNNICPTPLCLFKLFQHGIVSCRIRCQRAILQCSRNPSGSCLPEIKLYRCKNRHTRQQASICKEQTFSY